MRACRREKSRPQGLRGPADALCRPLAASRAHTHESELVSRCWIPTVRKTGDVPCHPISRPTSPPLSWAFKPPVFLIVERVYIMLWKETHTHLTTRTPDTPGPHSTLDSCVTRHHDSRRASSTSREGSSSHRRLKRSGSTLYMHVIDTYSTPDTERHVLPGFRRTHSSTTACHCDRFPSLGSPRHSEQRHKCLHTPCMYTIFPLRARPCHLSAHETWRGGRCRCAAGPRMAAHSAAAPGDRIS